MSEIVTLYKKEYLVGYLNEDIQPLLEMVLLNYNQGRNMAKTPDDIRHEDIRINFTPQVQRIARTLAEEWKKMTGLSFPFAVWAYHPETFSPLQLQQLTDAMK